MSDEITHETIYRLVNTIKYGPNYHLVAQNQPRPETFEQRIRGNAVDWVQVVHGSCDLELIKARKRNKTLT